MKNQREWYISEKLKSSMKRLQKKPYSRRYQSELLFWGRRVPMTDVEASKKRVSSARRTEAKNAQPR